MYLALIASLSIIITMYLTYKEGSKVHGSSPTSDITWALYNMNHTNRPSQLEREGDEHSNCSETMQIRWMIVPLCNIHILVARGYVKNPNVTVNIKSQTKWMSISMCLMR